MRKILVRFDDICPTIDWNQWERVLVVLEKYDIKPLIGVIPDNNDKDLMIDSARDDFWDHIRSLQKSGFVVAMHGYQHLLNSKHKGFVTNRKDSEFSGLSFDEQLIKIIKGKAILNNNGIETDVFFAPAHSYDENTLKALSTCGFNYISDGKTISPMIRNGIICIPCLDGGCPKIGKKSRYTAVFHVSEWRRSDKSHAYNEFLSLIEKYYNEIVPFYDYAKDDLGNKTFNNAYERIRVQYDSYFRSEVDKVKHWFKVAYRKILKGK